MVLQDKNEWFNMQVISLKDRIKQIRQISIHAPHLMFPRFVETYNI